MDLYWSNECTLFPMESHK